MSNEKEQYNKQGVCSECGGTENVNDVCVNCGWEVCTDCNSISVDEELICLTCQMEEDLENDNAG